MSKIREMRQFKFYDPEGAAFVVLTVKVAPAISNDAAFAIALRNHRLRGWLEDSTVRMWVDQLKTGIGRKAATRFVNAFVGVPLYDADDAHEAKQERFARLARALLAEPPPWVDRLVS